ncbi:MAG: NAD(P)/FAD-dependent oxidoreductase [Verrucomicrobiae bacterium]|nr:NAD(P)/FAD-dependent oxidoreductase [Verrucomicrobiae bacterium]
MKNCDLAVIGAGSAGYAAARTASKLGAKVVLIDGAKQLGGLCILRGCMPSKALLESSHRLHEIQRAPEFGLQVQSAKPNLTQILKRKKKLIQEFANYRAQEITHNTFTFIPGHASFLDSQHLRIQNEKKTQTLKFKKALIATGSVINTTSFSGLQKTGYFTSDEALEMTRYPKTLAVLGGGAIALELAQHFARLGTQVIIIQRSKQLLSDTDDDLAQVLENVLLRENITIFTNTQLLRFEKIKNKKQITFRHHNQLRKVQVDDIFYALGRRPNLDTLNLEKIGIHLNHGKIKVNLQMQTKLPHIYAAGDATGIHEIVHIAIEQGEIAANNALTKNKRSWNPNLKIFGLFTEPQLATVGHSEKELQQKKINYQTARYPFNDHGKALIQGTTDGFVKLMCHAKTGKLLGAAIVGPHATDLIHELAVVLYYHGTVQELATIPHYHPTLAEIITYPAEELVVSIKKTKKKKR